MKSNALTISARGNREIVMTRAFDAPRALVFDAFTKPDLIRRWQRNDGQDVAITSRLLSSVDGSFAPLRVTTVRASCHAAASPSTEPSLSRPSTAALSRNSAFA